MFRNALIASAMLFGTAGAALAQDNGPRLIGGGADGGPRVVYAEPSQNVVGGGYARITGEASNRSVAYAGPTTGQAVTGYVAQLVGGGREQALVYAPAQSGSPTLAAQTTDRIGG
ncbi:hypothetical protein JMJ56_04815 [Belnapia sp. T18]|uniref:Uncharacterized protein n=1 Tax=Belnapia arida TaxID=2804533 RepID=A0ABS1TY07_9PROT|nr:hypothetical protein [Belnapia arida]MBL6077318.1 hypothetical protein [Belnapia arida]